TARQTAERPESRRRGRPGRCSSRSSALSHPTPPPSTRTIQREPDGSGTGRLGEQDRRQALASGDRRFVGRPPRLETLEELLARAIIIPFAVAPHDLDQLIDRLLPAVLAVERDREVEAGLMVERAGGDLLLELGDRADRLRLLGELERGARRRHRRIVALG